MAVTNQDSGELTAKQMFMLLWETHQFDTRIIAERISNVIDRHRSLKRSAFAALQAKGENPYYHLPDGEQFCKNVRDEGWKEQLRVVMNTKTGRIRVVEKKPTLRKNEVIVFGVRVWQQREWAPRGRRSRVMVKCILTYPSTTSISGVRSVNCETFLTGTNNSFEVRSISQSLDWMLRKWSNNIDA
mgnify:CR=1 FL=1